MISAIVKALLTRIWPNWVRPACTASKWIEFVLCVSPVKRMLSYSVTVRPKRLRNTSPTSRSS